MCVLTASVVCLYEAPRSAAAPPTGEAHPLYSTVHPHSLTHTPTHGGTTIPSDVCYYSGGDQQGGASLCSQTSSSSVRTVNTPATRETAERGQNVPHCDSFLSPSRQKTETPPCITASGAPETCPRAPGLTSLGPGRLQKHGDGRRREPRPNWDLSRTKSIPDVCLFSFPFQPANHISQFDSSSSGCSPANGTRRC